MACAVRLTAGCVKMTSKFMIGDLVWAKMKYSPAWPAKVVDTPPGRQRKDSYFVYFYGSEKFGWVDKKDVCSYNTNYIKLFQQNVRNSKYTKGVKLIGQVYHETVQKKSPTYKKIKWEEEQRIKSAEKRTKSTVEEPVQIPEVNHELENDYLNRKKANRTVEEEEERQKKIQNRLKVRLFPKKGLKKRLKNKQKSTSKNGASSTCTSSPSPSSCITSVHIRDYKKLIPKEAHVLLRRCDEGLPTLKSNEKESHDEKESQNEKECPPDKPPTLSPEE